MQQLSLFDISRLFHVISLIIFQNFRIQMNYKFNFVDSNKFEVQVQPNTVLQFSAMSITALTPCTDCLRSHHTVLLQQSDKISSQSGAYDQGCWLVVGISKLDTARSISAVSKPNFASKYALESSRRDLQTVASLLTPLPPRQAESATGY